MMLTTRDRTTAGTAARILSHSPLETRLKTFAQALDLVDDPDRIDEYRNHHAHAWPEVVKGLRAIGILRLRIWLTGTRLFMTFEAPDDFDPDRDYQSYAEDARCGEWDRLMRTYQRRIPTADPTDGGWWTPMELVFDLEEQDG